MLKSQRFEIETNELMTRSKKPIEKHILSFASFNLIELLVVISILSILLSLLEPSMRGALNKAVQLSCASNQKKIYNYMDFYLSDNNEEYPYAATPNPNELPHWKSFWTYDEALSLYDGRNLSYDDDTYRWGAQPWQEDRPEYRCPNEEERGYLNAYRRTYVMNAGGRNNSRRKETDYIRGISRVSNEHTVLVTVSDVPDAAKTFLLVEIVANTLDSYDQQNVMGGGQNGFYSFADDPASQQADRLENQPWHENRWNYVFCDGHIESLDPYDTIGANGEMGWNGEIDAAQGMWTRDIND